MSQGLAHAPTGAMKSDSSWGMLYTITILIVFASVASGLYQGKKDKADQDRNWQRFASEHSCKVIGKKEPAGLSIVGQTGWSCDDGVIYWIDNQKTGSVLPQARDGTKK